MVCCREHGATASDTICQCVWKTTERHVREAPDLVALWETFHHRPLGRMCTDQPSDECQIKMIQYDKSKMRQECILLYKICFSTIKDLLLTENTVILYTSKESY